MDPLTIGAVGSLMKGASVAQRSPESGATGGMASSGGTLDSSNWTLNFGSSGGGFSPTVSSGSITWLMIAALIAAGLVWRAKKI